MANPTPVTIKKYGNRRLYDTEDSRYITLEELATKVRGGTDVRVIDAKTKADLTQATLTQIIIEGRGAAKLLPVPLLMQLIRLGDDALAEFFGRYVTGALEIYLQMRRGAQSVAPYNPLATMPFAATDALARMWMSNPLAGAGFAAEGTPGWGREASGHGGPSPRAEDEPESAPAGPPSGSEEVAALRRELDELKQSLEEGGQDKPPRGRRRARGGSRRR